MREVRTSTLVLVAVGAFVLIVLVLQLVGAVTRSVTSPSPTPEARLMPAWESPEAQPFSALFVDGYEILGKCPEWPALVVIQSHSPQRQLFISAGDAGISSSAWFALPDLDFCHDLASR